MLEKQISDLTKYYDSLNLHQKLDFIDRLKIKLDKEKDIRVKNELIRLKNSCVTKYNSEALTKHTKDNNRNKANKKVTQTT